MCSKYRSSNVVEVCRNCGWNIALTTACHFDISADAGEAAVGIDGSAGAVRGGDTVSTHYALYYIHTYIHSFYVFACGSEAAVGGGEMRSGHRRDYPAAETGG